MKRQEKFLIIGILLTFSISLLYPLSRSKNIPGVDPLPMAILEEKSQEPKSKNTQNTSNNSQNTTNTKKTISSISKEYPDFPRIRNLKVIPDPTYPYSARITWDAHPETATPIYIVRFSRPISTKEILFNSYNLTSPPLDPKTKSFIDRDLPEGVYYYAAVTSFEISQDGILVLKPKVNYTINPFIIYREQKSPNQQSNLIQKQNTKSQQEDRKKLLPSDFEIQELTAINSEKGVVLNWNPIKIDNIKYKIYRGEEPLDSAKRLQKAQLLGESTKPYFLDTNPLAGKPVYYGVSVVDLNSQKEYSDLKYRRSYISHTYKKPQLEYQFLEYLPDSLTAYQVNQNTIQLFWVNAGPGVKFYKVYRYNAPISSEQILQRAKFLGIAQSGSVGFIDKDLTPNRYFYAVMPVISNDRELRLFYGNRTFTTFGIVIKGIPENPIKISEENLSATKTKENTRTNIKNIVIKVENQNHIRISWDYVKENSNQIKVLIYRSLVQITKYEELKENSEYIGEFPLIAGVFVDRNLKPGNYYYNFIEYNMQTNQITAFYYLRKPVKIKAKIVKKKEKTKIQNISSEKQKLDRLSHLEEKPEQSKEKRKKSNYTKNIEKDIQKISKLIFRDKDYFQAETQIKQLLNQNQLSTLQKGKLKLYYGILLYKLNRIEEARIYFLDEDVQNYDKNRANFWFRRTIEKER